MKIRAAIYARTSPDCPVGIEDQHKHLKTIAGERGWTVEHVFTDRPTTVRGQDRRPGATALINAIRAGTIDRVLVHGIDRLGRTLADLVAFLEVCRTAGVSLWLDEQRIDTEQADGLLDLGEMLAFHIRQARRDRILRGQAAAKAMSIRFGRPPNAMAKVERAKRELAAGNGVRQAARLAGISAASVSRLKHTMGAAASP